ncbi:Flp family type IVb pilin [Candidatus Kaiserbacteria bacterium CG10_big_fil_rev_8_21_14_0_10_44_10]|uniref:Flp family type IVb pilin n=1 Tax=Candidatus Kaiserbacteria bacterium CG10_big_fil_rev_8_21_14_0_10_44_10 TaxID=1974606 RepID=A0A2H0UHX2_9BACT|nr:MAG: Flp family type IVb pilin [Candidatus Kaiserbacteria bacterium CG10_big_fil_rev_8_21_14_0_10_44_10]
MNSPIRRAVRRGKTTFGATAIEYGLIAALISVALITGATTLGDTIKKEFLELRTEQVSK